MWSFARAGTFVGATLLQGTKSAEDGPSLAREVRWVATKEKNMAGCDKRRDTGREGSSAEREQHVWRALRLRGAHERSQQDL